MAALEDSALDVSQEVFLQAARLRKALPTLHAVVVAPLLRAVMPDIFQRSRKTVAAFNAKVRCILTLPQPVTSQQGGCSERPPTLRAVVRLQAAVQPPVLDEDGTMLETFVALGAFVDTGLMPTARG